MFKRWLHFFTTLLMISSIFQLTDIYAGGPDQQPTSAPWHFTVAPYGWIFGQNGDMTVQGTKTHIDLTPIDVLKNIHYLDFIFQLHMEAAKGPWAVMVDSTYMKISPTSRVDLGTVTVPPGSVPASLDIKTTIKFSILDMGTYYTFLQKTFSQPYRWIKIEGLLGARDVYIAASMNLTPLRLAQQSASGNANWFSPMTGARMTLHIWRPFAILLSGDVAGTGSNFSWNTTALGSYSFNHYTALALGYRVLSFDGSRGSGANKFKMDMIYYGPVIGLVVTW
ncbi:MAG: hypothetical protein COB66_01110 [Coxiella sp. (in: Bacteria)]|nr:MAG: hypothetical protein COB66_01110 [Coxiella sp. (in: g-proteobacteria)]